MTLLSGVLLSGSAIIDLDGTIFVQIGIFFVTFFVLKALVFRPMMALFEAREEAIDGARAGAKKMEREALDKADAFDEQMRKVRVTTSEERERLRQEGVQLERSILERVREETQQKLADAEARISAERKGLQSEIQTNVQALASQIASKLLEREVR